MKIPEQKPFYINGKKTRFDIIQTSLGSTFIDTITEYHVLIYSMRIALYTQDTQSKGWKLLVKALSEYDSSVQLYNNDWVFDRRKTILIDMDDVMVDLLGYISEFVNKKFNTSYTKDDFTSWDLTDVLTEEQLKYVRDYPELFAYLPIKEGCKEALLKLKNYYNLKIVTSAWWDTVKYKVEWFKRNDMWFINESDIVVTRDKSLVKGDYIIDDGIHNIENVLKDNPEMKCILMTSSHNKNYKNDKVLRVESWDEIYNLLKLK